MRVTVEFMAGGRFSASYDLTTKIISTLVCCGMLAIALMVSNIYLVIPAMLIALLGYAYSPRAYVLAGAAITIERLIGSVRFPLEGLREARQIEPGDLTGCIRLWGSGGFFGYYGLFRTSKLGKSTWYATNRKNMVVVITPEKTALFSPDDVEGFLATILGSAGSGSSGGSRGSGSGSAGSGSSGFGEG